jgi:translation initiation factor IF-2
MEGMREPKIQEESGGECEVREVFKFDKAYVAGCFVLEGRIKRDSKIRVIRDGIVVYPSQGGSADLQSLKRFKDDVKDVQMAYGMRSCGEDYNDIKVGDIVEP